MMISTDPPMPLWRANRLGQSPASHLSLREPRQCCTRGGQRQTCATVHTRSIYTVYRVVGLVVGKCQAMATNTSGKIQQLQEKTTCTDYTVARASLSPSHPSSYGSLGPADGQRVINPLPRVLSTTASNKAVVVEGDAKRFPYGRIGSRSDGDTEQQR